MVAAAAEDARGAAARLEAIWRRGGVAQWLLRPLALLHATLVGLRRGLYRAGLLRREHLPVPVIVVGNRVAGGAGKTPVTIALVEALRAAGRRPGIVSRGHGRSDLAALHEVQPQDPAATCGDEPLLMRRRTGAPVVVGRDRAAAARQLLARHPDTDVIVCDDGLQHLRLARDIEIVVFDERGAGNGWLLPAGPLREPLSRLRTVDAVVAHDPRQVRTLVPAGVPLHGLRLEPEAIVSLDDPSRRLPLAAFSGRRVHAVAGIGRPERFFATLRALGAEVVPHAFPDHHPYRAENLDFGAPGEWRIFTSKDAVKCRAYARPHDWVLTVRARLDEALVERILERIHGHSSAGRAGMPAVQGAAQIRP